MSQSSLSVVRYDLFDDPHKEQDFSKTLEVQVFPIEAISKVRVLLLEKVHTAAVEILKKEGYEVECLTGALDEVELTTKIKGVHVLGIRSKTQVTETVLREAKNLLTIGCFCIGTNQVDLSTSELLGIPIFNSPFSNSRSVAELVLSEIILLARQVPDRDKEMHQGIWNKTVTNCHEIRGKTLGIVGYGHIGSQLSLLAESMGMFILYYDILQIMPLGSSTQVDSLKTLLMKSDFVTLHVPATKDTVDMIGEEEIKLMKRGSCLINASRGSVVKLQALREALDRGHLAGAAVDVYPSEPTGDSKDFKSVLQGAPNTILTPHIGGSTEEAQRAIGVEVATAIVKYVQSGTTAGAVNFPQIDMRIETGSTDGWARILNVHKNVPGVLKQINRILADVMIDKQICDSYGDIAYFIADITFKDSVSWENLIRQIATIPASIRTRIIRAGDLNLSDNVKSK